MKIFNRTRILGLAFCLIPMCAFAAGDTIEQDVRDLYLPTANAMCHGSTEYTLDQPYEELDGEEGVKDLYNKRMECLFESAFVKATNDMNTDFKKEFFAGIFDPKDPYIPKDRELKASDCSGMELGDIFQDQVSNGYQTLCVIDDRKSTVEEAYSSCRVAEVAWNEFCAYQEYLSWKQNDETIFLEFKKRWDEDPNEYIPSNTYFNNDYAPTERAKYQREITNSYRVLWETLEQYHEFEQSYRLYLWEQVIIESLKVTQEKYTLIRKALKTWSWKFHNASAL